MPVKVKNTTESEITLDDLGGIVIPADGTYVDLSESFTAIDLALSDDLLEHIASGSLVVNTGEVDLSIADGIRYVSLYKHLNPVYPDGKEVIRAESRPPGSTTTFTMRGDDQAIGDGKVLMWDFSNTDDDIPAPEGYRRKRIRLRFNDYVYIKDGCLYFFNALFGSYADMYVVCPAGQYYRDRQGNLVQATEDTPVVHYVIHHMFCGTCPMGDELNAEGCQIDPLPPNYELWVEITVPSSDSQSKGYGELELYRTRNILLPGEEV